MVTNFFAKELIWEYKNAYYPKNILDLKGKIEELDAWGREKNYPFLLELHLTNDSHLGFTVSHDYSLIEFGYSDKGKQKGPFYLVNPDGNRDEIIPIYYFGSYTEPDTTRMLPFQKVLEAVYFYVEHKKFPSFIQFDDEEVNKKFVDLGGRLATETS
jgi:hypothetical protein